LGIGGVAAALGYKWYDLYQPPDHTFIEKKTDLINEISEMIIPKTDTPGAKDVNVAAFVIYAAKEILEKKERNTFINGLKKIDAYCINVHHKEFLHCSHSERLDALKYMRDDLHLSSFWKKVQRKITGRSFMDILRELVVVGYCTSEAGATQGLAFDFIPGSYTGCISLRPGQKSWATK
jgi:hypothetical protein